MGQVLHGSATTTEAVRRAIQLREESVRALAQRYSVSPTTVQKWRKRATTALHEQVALRAAAVLTLRGLTPYEAICKAWSAEPGSFRSNPLHQMPGPSSQTIPKWDGAEL